MLVQRYRSWTGSWQCLMRHSGNKSSYNNYVAVCFVLRWEVWKVCCLRQSSRAAKVMYCWWFHWNRRKRISQRNFFTVRLNVNITSTLMASFRPFDYRTWHSADNALITQLSRAIALDWFCQLSDHGIRLLCTRNVDTNNRWYLYITSLSLGYNCPLADSPRP